MYAIRSYYAPDEVALKDRPLQITVLLWGLAVIAVAAGLLLRNSPSDLGLAPLGQGNTAGENPLPSPPNAAGKGTMLP